MERRYHSTSHLGRCNIDALLPDAEIAMRKQYAHAAEVAHRIYCQGKTYGITGMTARGRKAFLAAREALRLLDAAYYGEIKQVGL